jgi:agmatine deiminase
LDKASAEAEEARSAWASVANAIVRFEPVSVLASSDQLEIARAYLHPSIELIEAEIDDAWMRDSGPTFVKDDSGNLVAVNWVFNGWGRKTGPLGQRQTGCRIYRQACRKSCSRFTADQ